MNFEKLFEARWADLDPSAHMKSVAYLEYATHVRFAFMKELGFDINYFGVNKFNPIFFEEKVNFVKEIRAQQSFTVNAVMISLSDSGHKWVMKHEFKSTAGKLFAVVSCVGAFLSLTERKIVAPPEDVLQALQKMPKGEAFKPTY